MACEKNSLNNSKCDCIFTNKYWDDI